jgi:hypothetical protein
MQRRQQMSSLSGCSSLESSSFVRSHAHVFTAQQMVMLHDATWRVFQVNWKNKWAAHMAWAARPLRAKQNVATD